MTDAAEEAEQAAHQAEDAAQRADEAQEEARRFASGAERAEEQAEQAEEQAERAEERAERAAEEAEHAEQLAEQAASEALAVDELLLEEEAQKVAAQVSDEQPFGIPGKPIDRRNQVRAGFTVAVGVLLAIALGEAVVALRQELLVIVVASFIAIGLAPVVAWLSRRGLPRWAAVLIVSLVVVGAMAGFLAAAVPPLVREGHQLITNGPSHFLHLKDKHGFVARLNNRFHIESKLQSAAKHDFNIGSSGVIKVGAAIVSFSFETVVVIVLVIYILAGFDDIKRFFYRLVPLERRPRVALLGDEILSRTGGYILGNIFTSLIAVLCQYVILRILGVPYALVLSLFVGIFDLVPLVGSTIAGLLVTAVTLAAVSVTAAIINVIFTILYRLAEDYLISPRILQRTVDVKPLTTVVAVVLGGALLGIVGALIAVPAAAALQLIITEVVYPKMDRANPVPEPEGG